MSASVGSGSDEAAAAAAEAMGLLTDHAYSLLRVVDVPPSDVSGASGRPARLVQLRNPWGKLAWKGDWSETSPLWTRDLHRRLHGEHDGRGTFWMAFEDMVDYFRTIEACRVRPEWAEVRVRGKLPPLGAVGTGGLGAFELNVLQNSAVEVSLLQRNGRGLDDYQMQDLLVLVLERTGGGGGGGRSGGGHAVAGMRLVAASERQLKACVTCEVVLSAGQFPPSNSRSSDSMSTECLECRLSANRVPVEWQFSAPLSASECLCGYPWSQESTTSCLSRYGRAPPTSPATRRCSTSSA